MSLFYVLYVHCRGRAVTDVGKTCGPTPCLTRAINMFKLGAKVCLPFTAPHTQNRKDVNRISFLNRGYAFNCLVAVIKEIQNLWCGFE